MAGVNWNVNIDAPGGKVKAASGVVTLLEKHLKSIDETTQKLAGHFDEMGGHAEKAGNHAHGLFGEILGGELAAHAIEKLVEKVKELGEEAVKAAANEQRMLRVFTSAAGGSDELGRQNEEWTDILAKRTELSQMQTEGAFIDMKRVGATDQEAKIALKAAADIAAVSKDKNESFAATMEAFQRIQRTGQISSRALAPLGIGVKDFKQLDSMKGLSDKAIKKKMEEGKVDRADLFRLIMSRTGESAIGEKAAANADLLTTKLDKLKELPDLFWKKLGQGKGAEKLASTLGKALEKLDPDSPFGKRAVAFMENVFDAGTDAVGVLIDQVGKIDFEKLMGTVNDDVVPALKTMIGWINPIIEAIERIIAGFHRMHDIAVTTFRTATGGAFDEGPAVAAGRAARRDQAAAVAAAAPKMVDLGHGAKAHHTAFQLVGKQAAAGMAAGMSQGFSLVDDVASQLAERAADATRDKLQVKSPSVVFEDIGAMTAAGYVQGLERAAPDVDKAIQAAFTVPKIQGGRSGGIMGGVVMTFGDLYFSVDGHGAPEEVGRRMADSFKKEIRADWLSMLEQARIEEGA